MQKLIIAVLSVIFIIGNARFVAAHCEIPCGIYDDAQRIAMITEHIDTIEKSMQEIKSLSEQGDKNYNQIVRWVHNKEKHAIEIQHIVAQYFLTQRIKLVDSESLEMVALRLKQLDFLHQLLVYAMKAKQTTDLAYTEKLRDVLSSFVTIYGQKSVSEHKH